MKKLETIPVTLAEANAFIKRHHRHHRPVVGHLLCIGAASDGEVVGVCVVGRPVARALQDGRTAEVVRLCTDGTRNACSLLYAAAWRACRAIGYHRLVTYTLPKEGGASLRAAGWQLIGETAGGSWNTPSRPRTDKAPIDPKLRWEAPSSVTAAAENRNARQHCEQCGRCVSVYGITRKRRGIRYCSDACRQKAYRKRKADR